MTIARALAAILLACACSFDTARATAASPPSQTPLPDVLLIVADDMSASELAHVSPLVNLSALAARGLTFDRFYAQAWCAPMRDSLHRSLWNGVTHLRWPCEPPNPASLDMANTYALGKVMRDAGYHTAHVGKWDLGVPADGSPWDSAPQQMGFDSSLVPFPIPPSCAPSAGTPDCGETRDALVAWWNSTPSPRFAVVNFEAAHAPWDYPADADLPPGYAPPLSRQRFATNREKYEAEIVGLDWVLADMVALTGPEDWVIFTSDNGTPQGATRPDQDPTRVKISCYEEGVRVPLILVGPGVPAGARTDALTHVADILPTLRDVLGIAGPPLDGRSLALGHDVVICQSGPAVNAAIGLRWKLLNTPALGEQLFDLSADPDEMFPLPAIGPVANYLRSKRVAALGH